MIFVEDQVRLTPSERDALRSAAARNGFVYNRIATRDELLQAVLDGLTPQTQADLLAYLEEHGPAAT